MSDERVRSRIGEWIICIVLLAPFLLLGLSYLEHVFIKTHRLKEALHVDQVVHALDAIILHR